MRPSWLNQSLADPGFYDLPRPLLSSYADLQIQGFSAGTGVVTNN
jgi:hypothetical protein